MTKTRYTMTTKERSIPKLEPRLAVQHNYAEWVSTIETVLIMYDIGDGTRWDIVRGTVTEPKGKAKAVAKDEKAKGVSETAATTTVPETEWKKANFFAILTMKKNCEPNILPKIGITKDAQQAYKNLREYYEGKIVTDLRSILASVVKSTNDDRLKTINEHIENFERK
jgi:hypothetical protein